MIYIYIAKQQYFYYVNLLATDNLNWFLQNYSSNATNKNKDNIYEPICSRNMSMIEFQLKYLLDASYFNYPKFVKGSPAKSYWYGW